MFEDKTNFLFVYNIQMEVKKGKYTFFITNNIEKWNECFAIKTTVDHKRRNERQANERNKLSKENKTTTEPSNGRIRRTRNDEKSGVGGVYLYL